MSYLQIKFKIFYIVIYIVLCFCTTVSTFAQQKDSIKRNLSLNRFFIQAQTGVFFSQTTYSNAVKYQNIDALKPLMNNTTLQAYISGHQVSLGYYLNRNWSVELGYQYNRYQYVYPLHDNIPKGTLGNAHAIFTRWHRDINLNTIYLPQLTISLGAGLGVLFHDKPSDNSLFGNYLENQKVNIITWQGNNNLQADTLLLDGGTYRKIRNNINVDLSTKLLYKTNKHLQIGLYANYIWLSASPYEQEWYIQKNNKTYIISMNYDTYGIYTGVLLRYLF